MGEIIPSKYREKYYKELINKENKTSFEEYYIKLIDTGDMSEFKECLKDSLYKDADDCQFGIEGGNITFYLYKGKYEYLIDLFPEYCELSICTLDDVEEDDSIDKIVDLTYEEDIKSIFNSLLLELAKLDIYFHSDQRKIDEKEKLFDETNLEDKFTLYMKGDKGTVTMGLVIVFLLLIAFFISLNKNTNTFGAVFITLMIVAFSCYTITYLLKIGTLNAYKNKIKLDKEEVEVKGKASFVRLMKKGTTSRYAANQLAYIILTIEGVKYLAILPEPIVIKSKTRKELMDAILKMDLELKVKNESHIIVLKDSKFYDDIMKILDK